MGQLKLVGLEFRTCDQDVIPVEVSDSAYDVKVKTASILGTSAR